MLCLVTPTRGAAPREPALAAAPALPPPLPPKLLIIVVILQEVGHTGSDGRSDFPVETFGGVTQSEILQIWNRRYFLSAQNAAPSPLPVPVGDPAVVVESGPVVYDDAAAEDEEEEEEEACVSAMDLLGGNGQSQLPVTERRRFHHVTKFSLVFLVFCIWRLDSETVPVFNESSRGSRRSPPAGHGARRRRALTRPQKLLCFPSLCLRL